MDDFLSDITDHDIALAKKRIWNQMQSKLPDRGLSSYQSVVSALRTSRKNAKGSRLQQVILKERLMDLLPDRKVRNFSFSRRVWAMSTLSIFFAFLFVPVFQISEVASASTFNLLEVVQGDVMVNGTPVLETAFVQEGDRIHTEAGSMAHVTFVDDSRITLGPNTSVSFLDIDINPINRAQTEITVDVSEGRVWMQVLNLVSQDSFFALSFPNGEAVVDQRASFDLRVDGEETELQVARNLVTVSVMSDELYEGTLGQGALMLVTDSVETQELPEGYESDVWWDFNLAYGKMYAQKLDEKYQNEAIERVRILPGNPLYVFKTFREAIQESFAITKESKQALVAQHAQNRLDEAQILLGQGRLGEAEDVLEEYKEKVEESLVDSDDETTLARLEEAQKELFAMQEVDEGMQLLEDQVVEASALVTSKITDKSETRMLSASQKLQRVPDLIAEGGFEQALDYLLAYQEESLSLLVQLEDVSLEEREELISTLLEQKLKDLQILRLIAALPEFEEVLDADAQIYEEMSMMVLTLRERALNRLSDFFTATDYDVDVQVDVYSRLKDSSEMAPELSEQFDSMEEELVSSEESPVVMDVEPIPVPVDHRLDISHADEAEDEANDGE